MTTDPAGQAVAPGAAGAIPEWTLGWRLQRSLAHAEMRAEDMAEEVGVNRATVSRWMHDKGAAPRTIYVKHWALRTGVPYEWLQSGDDAPEPSDSEVPGIPLNRGCGGIARLRLPEAA